MTTSTSCSWCHSLNAVDRDPWPTCWQCGHRADLARMLCPCPKCRPLRRLGFEGEQLTFQGQRWD